MAVDTDMYVETEVQRSGDGVTKQEKESAQDRRLMRCWAQGMDRPHVCSHPLTHHMTHTRVVYLQQRRRHLVACIVLGDDGECRQLLALAAACVGVDCYRHLRMLLQQLNHCRQVCLLLFLCCCCLCWCVEGRGSQSLCAELGAAASRHAHHWWLPTQSASVCD